MRPMQIIFSQCIITNVQKGRGEAAVVAAATVYVGRPRVGMSFWAKVVRCCDCSADVSNCLRTCAVSLAYAVLISINSRATLSRMALSLQKAEFRQVAGDLVSG